MKHLILSAILVGLVVTSTPVRAETIAVIGTGMMGGLYWSKISGAWSYDHLWFPRSGK